MKANQDLAIVGEKVMLVPYRPEHVEKYHEWMRDPELRELTASESLSLEEEYEMQRKWQEDEDKLTFIVLSREEPRSEESNNLVKAARKSIYDTSLMLGDVNLFFKGSAGDEDFEVEAEIMIAERPYRRNGLATEAIQLLLSFATSFHCQTPPSGSPNAVKHTLPISADKLVARIGTKNGASQALFAKLGFVVTKHVEVFDEVEMRLVDDDLIRRINEWSKGKVVGLGHDWLC